MKKSANKKRGDLHALWREDHLVYIKIGFGGLPWDNRAAKEGRRPPLALVCEKTDMRAAKEAEGPPLASGCGLSYTSTPMDMRAAKEAEGPPLASGCDLTNTYTPMEQGKIIMHLHRVDQPTLIGGPKTNKGK